MELAPIFVLLIALGFLSGNNSSSSDEEPFYLERKGRVITIKDKCNPNFVNIRTFSSEEEANRWYLNRNEYLENPEGKPRPRRCCNLVRK